MLILQMPVRVFSSSLLTYINIIRDYKSAYMLYPIGHVMSSRSLFNNVLRYVSFVIREL